MRIAIAVFTTLCVFQLGLLAAHAEEPTARQIIDKMVDENRMGFDTGEARVRLKVTDRNGYVKDQVVQSQADKKGGLRRTYLKFLDPADVRGTIFLSLERKGKDDIQYLYLPALKRSRRIAGSAKNGRSMGTDFTYSDLEFRDAKEGKVRKEADATSGKRPVYVVVAEPSDGDDAYSSVKMWIDKKLHIPLKIEFYDRGKKLQKVLKVLKLKKKKSTGRIYASKFRMKNVQENTQTVMILESLNESAQLPDRLFDPNLLGQ